MILLFFCLNLERITDGEMQGLHIFETAEVEIARAAAGEGCLRIVEDETPVNTDHEEP